MIIPQFVAHQTGRYTVSYRCASATLSHSLDVFAPTLDVKAEGPLKLASLCLETHVTASGRLLCVAFGVHVLDMVTGALLGDTDTYFGMSQGIAVQDDLFATPAARFAQLYQVGATGAPEMLSALPPQGCQQLAFAGDHLYMTTNTQLVLFDIKDPKQPRQVGCLSGDLHNVVPLELSGKLYALSIRNVRSFELSALTMGCDQAVPPLSQVDLGGEDSASNWVTQGGFLYGASEHGLEVVDARQPMALQKVLHLDMPISAIAVHDGKLFVSEEILGGGRETVYIFDLSDPAQPRPIGKWNATDDASFAMTKAKIWVTTGDQLWSLTVK